MTDETGFASTPTYRGQRVVKSKSEIYLSSMKKLPMDRSNLLDRGFLQYFEKNPAARITKEESSEIVAFTPLKNMRLDEIINLRKQNNEFYKDLKISKFSAVSGVGFAPIGRGGVSYPSIEQLRGDSDDDYNEKKYKDFIEGLAEYDDELAAFVESAKKYGMPCDPGDLPKSVKDLTLFGKVYADYLYGSQVPKIVPTAAAIAKANNQFISLDYLVDNRITKFGKSKAELWNAQGEFYVLEGKGKRQILWYADGFSKNGSEVTLIMRGIDETRRKERAKLFTEELIKAFEQKNDPLVRIAGTGKLMDYLKKTGDGVIIDLRRNYDPETEELDKGLTSPITHVPLIDLSDKAPQVALISIGEIDSQSSTRENTLIVSNFPGK